MRVNDCNFVECLSAYVCEGDKEKEKSKDKGNAVVPQQVVKLANGYNLFHLGYSSLHGVAILCHCNLLYFLVIGVFSQDSSTLGEPLAINYSSPEVLFKLDSWHLPLVVEVWVVGHLA